MSPTSGCCCRWFNVLFVDSLVFVDVDAFFFPVSDSKLAKKSVNFLFLFIFLVFSCLVVLSHVNVF